MSTNNDVTELTVIEQLDGSHALGFSRMDCTGMDGEACGFVTLPEPMTVTGAATWVARDDTAKDAFSECLTDQEFKKLRRDVRNSAWDENNTDEPDV